MHKHEAAVGIDRLDRVQRMDMIRAFQHPSAAATLLALKVLEKAFVETIGRNVSRRIEPFLI